MNDGGEYGSAVLHPRVATAGQRGCWEIEYTAGAAGIAQGGGLRIIPPNKATVLWRLGKVIATCANPAVYLEVAADRMYPLTYHHSNYPAVHITVFGADLTEGETIRVQLGVLGGYNSGWFIQTQAQTHTQTTEFDVYVDPIGNAEFSRERARPSAAKKVGGELDITVLPAREDHIRISLRSRPRDDAEEILVVAVEDRFENPIPNHRYEATLSAENGSAEFPQSVVKPEGRDGSAAVVVARDGEICRIGARSWPHGIYGVSNPLAPGFFGGEYRAYFGDMHVMTGSGDCPSMQGTTEDALRYAKEVFGLDFCTVTNPLTPSRWPHDQEMFREYHKDYEFVTLPAYENGYATGHKNVYYFDESLAAIPVGEGLEALWKFLAGKKAMVISHHPNVHSETDPNEGWGPLEISTINPTFESLIEICQTRGSFEVDARGGEVVFGGFGSSIRDVLARGYRLGFVGGTDDHRARPGSRQCCLSGMDATAYNAGGITCVLAEELTREAVWRALRARRCYAATSTRILLDFQINGLRMGQDQRIEPQAPGAFDQRKIRIKAIGTYELAEAVVVRNGREVYRQEINAMDVETCWTDDEPLDKVIDKEIRGVYYYVKVRQHDGNLAWASPIWLTCDPG